MTSDPRSHHDATTASTETRALPAPGTWTIDASHSSVEFVVRHLMVAKVRGRFAEFGGTIQVGETPEESSVEVDITPASITTGDPQRDGHLPSADFFDVEAYPTITFRQHRRAHRRATATRWTES